MDGTKPIGTIDFNTDTDSERVHEILEQIRKLDGVIAFEQNHTSSYTIAEKN